MLVELNSILEKYNYGRENLISILQDVQENYGYIPADAVKEISHKLNLPSSKIFGMATFYNQFRFSPKGKYHIKLCYGTACHLVGASTFLKEIERLLKIKDGQTSPDSLFSLEVKSCIGSCGQAPVIAINDEFYPKINMEQLREILSNISLLNE